MGEVERGCNSSSEDAALALGEGNGFAIGGREGFGVTGDQPIGFLGRQHGESKSNFPLIIS